MNFVYYVIFKIFLNFQEWLKKLNLVGHGTQTVHSEDLFKPTPYDLRRIAEVFRQTELCMVLCLVKYVEICTYLTYMKESLMLE